MTAGKIAIVGAGPSGCFLAQSLLKAAPELEVDLIDRLPVPYGLVRYGVAADHQGTKGVARQFARIFERQGAQFHGNITLGQEVTLEALQTAYDAVVLAAGLMQDRALEIPGGDLPGIHGAGAITRALYDHPDATPLPDLGPRPLIVGNGNVAIDLLRLLAKQPEELEGSDLGPVATGWLRQNGVEEITITGRSPAAQAKFDTVMIKELSKLSGVTIHVEGAGSSEDAAEAKKIEAVLALHGHATGPRRVTFRFGLTPLAVEGDERVTAMRFQTTAGEETLPCTSVLTAIGFCADGVLPRDTLLAGAQDAEAGVLAPGLYATGWFRRGPRGTIPENRADAQALATRILAELTPDPDKPGRVILSDLDARVDYSGWTRIDAHEIATAPDDRCRAKIASREEMLRLAREEEKTK
ncbi:FAD-dependent oxidoreductase [Pseudodonghicola flavimaris]|uniref:FAD-dependent oxidoreductase n=1 Tax=Pseudodonghicola flavimaris TaxID=3050036 RepID=A0ABT7F6E9_9RHOB|nr:FAD-dependent oxidoreductase [Pseudodonghicola flavimaris]MDK3020173.1 FAD-dependent oxidoreductase [Pseudodonghicola flavimaris]